MPLPHQYVPWGLMELTRLIGLMRISRQPPAFAPVSLFTSDQIRDVVVFLLLETECRVRARQADAAWQTVAEMRQVIHVVTTTLA